MSVFDFESTEALIAEIFPDGRPTPLESGGYLREDTFGWAVSRRRLLMAGIRLADEERVKIVLNEYANLVGISGAIKAYILIWQLVVEQMDLEDDHK